MDNFEDLEKEFDRMIEEISKMTGADTQEIKEEIDKAESFDELLGKAFSFMDDDGDDEDDKE